MSGWLHGACKNGCKPPGCGYCVPYVGCAIGNLDWWCDDPPQFPDLQATFNISHRWDPHWNRCSSELGPHPDYECICTCVEGYNVCQTDSISVNLYWEWFSSCPSTGECDTALSSFGLDGGDHPDGCGKAGYSFSVTSDTATYTGSSDCCNGCVGETRNLSYLYTCGYAGNPVGTKICEDGLGNQSLGGGHKFWFAFGGQQGEYWLDNSSEDCCYYADPPQTNVGPISDWNSYKGMLGTYKLYKYQTYMSYEGYPCVGIAGPSMWDIDDRGPGGYRCNDDGGCTDPPLLQCQPFHWDFDLEWRATGVADIGYADHKIESGSPGNPPSDLFDYGSGSFPTSFTVSEA